MNEARYSILLARVGVALDPVPEERRRIPSI